MAWRNPLVARASRPCEPKFKIWRSSSVHDLFPGIFSLILLLLGVRPSPAAATLDIQTVDSVTIGNNQNEKAHKMQGDQTETQEFNGHTYRVANTNGWFSWELKILPDAPQEMDIEFGGERRRPADTV